MARSQYEQRSVMLSLQTFLASAGWTGANEVVIKDGYQSDETINNPQVTITFPPSSMKELQLGRNGDKLFARRILVNAYMETEKRASAIADDIMDFLDESCVDIVDPAAQTLGWIQCPDSEQIRAEVFPPIMSNPKLLRWRAAVQAPMEAFYPEDI